MALDWAHRALCTAREEDLTDPELGNDLGNCLATNAHILESLGRLDEAMALDAEWLALNPGEWPQDISMRRAMKHMAAGEDAEAELLLRGCLYDPIPRFRKHHTRTVEAALRPYTVLAELLERRGTEEALAEARMLRDKVAEQLATHEASQAAALEETRAAAVEAVRQWRGKRIKAREQQKRGKKTGKGKKKGRKAKGKRASCAAAVVEREPPHEPAGGEAEGVAAVEGAAAAEAEQHAQGVESQPREDDEEVEECAICLQDLELEDDEEDPGGDEGGEGEALVVLTCGHRFHEMCGDMWCSKCAEKGWGVTCPRCRAAYVLVRR
jgi:tetratricopeptide (TPR) repeat protein